MASGIAGSHILFLAAGLLVGFSFHNMNPVQITAGWNLLIAGLGAICFLVGEVAAKRQ